MQYWRTLFNRQSHVSGKPSYPVTPITLPTTVTTTVQTSQAPPPTSPALKFNVATNSQYLPLVAF